MQNIFNNKPVQLAQGEVIALRIKGRVKLKVMTGRVWVTLQGDSADYWLCGGQQIDIPGYGILVIEAACGSSQVVMESPRQPWRQRSASVIERVTSVHTVVSVPLLLLVCISLLRLRQ